MSVQDFDLATFLAMAPGDLGRLARLAEAYEKSTRTTLIKLSDAIEQLNLNQTRDLGHKLKSGSIWFGAPALGAIGAQLEALSEAAGMTSAQTLRVAAEASFARVLTEVAAALAAPVNLGEDSHVTE